MRVKTCKTEHLYLNLIYFGRESVAVTLLVLLRHILIRTVV